MTIMRTVESVVIDSTLAARYRPHSGGPVLLTGVQAIARQLVEQHERDARAGRRVATFVSGYQGSPLAGLDQLLASLPELASEHDVRLVPGVNEELAATSVWGSQLELPTGTRSYDGVVGVWYGKGSRSGPCQRCTAPRCHVRREPGRRSASLGRRRPGVEIFQRPRSE